MGPSGVVTVNKLLLLGAIIEGEGEGEEIEGDQQFLLNVACLEMKIMA